MQEFITKFIFHTDGTVEEVRNYKLTEQEKLELEKADDFMRDYEKLLR